jgi:hypothetical protein
MKKEDSAFTIYATVCSLLMLAILFLTLFTVKKSENLTDGQASDIFTPQTEYVYVYVSPDESSGVPADTDDSKGWIVREHEERIGIFNSDNVLIHIIETHIKTLPVADRDLLREGIKVNSRKELLSVIEDYTG